MLILLAIMLILFAESVPAAGIGASPAVLDFENVLKGGSMQKSVVVTNTDAEAAVFNASASRYQEWFSFEPNPVEIGGKSSKEVKVTANIPKDAPNGKYNATILIKAASPNLTGRASSFGLLPAIGLLARIIVTGNETVRWKVSGIRAKDVEEGQNVSIYADFANEGNVVIEPLVSAEIMKEGVSIDNISKKGSVKSGETKRIGLEWPSKSEGEYSALIKVDLAGNEIKKEKVSFKILPLGSASRSGEASEIAIPGVIEEGKIYKLATLFRNTGSLPVEAKLKVEVHFNNELTEAVESEEMLVEKGGETNLSAYFRPQKGGEYILKPFVYYSGKEIRLNDIRAATSGATGLVIQEKAGIAAFILLAGAAGLLFLRRKRDQSYHFQPQS
ncbi:MAG: hypothetical protein HYX24_00935 [Candidatus Aenigmarchaeota archaeon]|nr:hypothetical protein [Candidatus Aenigmarchaeota archaeon]